MAFELFTISPLEMFEGVIHTAFTDLVPGEAAFDGYLQDFTVMDNVPNKRPIVDVRKKYNILQRRDASCDLNYKRIMGTSTRRIEVSDLYGAVKQCKNELYQGALRDWEHEDELFGNNILPFFQDAMRIDMASNCWFGDEARAKTANQGFAYCEYDGILKWMQFYYTAGLIPAAQSVAMPAQNMRAQPQYAYQVLDSLYNSMSPLQRALPPTQMRIYVDAPVLDGYKKYLKQLGTTVEYIKLYADGVDVATFNGIPIIVIPIWEPILADLHGDANHHIAILTFKGNFVFATDKKYGEGEDGETALMVWYEKKELSWYWQNFLRAGTQIAEPEMISFAIN